MRLERTKNASRNIFWGVVNKLVTIIVPFIMRTILIFTLGQEYLGLSNLFSSILQVLSLAELGFGSAMVYSMYKPVADNDNNMLCLLLNFYRRIYRIVGSIILFAGIAVMPFFPCFISGSSPKGINLYALYLLYLGNTVISYFMFSYRASLLTAYQRVDIIANIGTAVHLLLYIIQIIMLFLLKNYYWYVIWLPVFTIIENACKGMAAKRLFPYILCKGKLSVEYKQGIYKRVRALVGHKLSDVVANSFDTIVLSSFLGLSVQSLYNNYYFILSALAGIISTCYASFTAGIGNSIEMDTVDKNYSDFNGITMINAWGVGWCSICLICLYQPFMKLWMGESRLLDISTVLLLGIYFYVWEIRKGVLLYKDAAGMWWSDRIKPYVEMAVNLCSNLILVQMIGINGVIVSTIGSMLLISFPWETKALFRLYFKKNAVSYFIRIGVYLTGTVGIGCLTYYCCSFVSFGGAAGLLLKAFICLLLPHILFFIMLRKTQEFQFLFHKAAKILKKGRRSGKY